LSDVYGKNVQDELYLSMRCERGNTVGIHYKGRTVIPAAL